MHYTATFRTHLDPQAAGTLYYPMDVDDLPAASGSRPDRLLDVSGPQERVQRHTVDQIVVAVSALPTFDVPVPQTVDQLVGALLHLDTPIPVHAIFEVPKISCPSRFPRSAVRESQKAEQLVEAPTLVSLVEVIEQPVDIPVRAWGGSSRFSSWPEFLVCGADRRHSSSSSWYLWRFPRFSPRTEFNSSRRADR